MYDKAQITQMSWLNLDDGAKCQNKIIPRSSPIVTQRGARWRHYVTARARHRRSVAAVLEYEPDARIEKRKLSQITRRLLIIDIFILKQRTSIT